jgi:hypothetical protein
MKDQSEFFAKHGYAYLKNVLTPEQCLRFAGILLAMKEENMLHYEGKTADQPNAFYDNSFGGNHAEFEAALREVQPRVEQELGLVGKMTPANSFGRIYYNGGTLAQHVDRDGLDYTISITLYNNLKTDWPLWAVDKLNNTVPLNIGIGDGGMILGTTMKHWRDPLVCDPDDYVIQLFMHWSFV